GRAVRRVLDHARRRSPHCTATPSWPILYRSDTTAGRAVAIVARDAAIHVHRLGSTASHRLCQSETASPALCRLVEPAMGLAGYWQPWSGPGRCATAARH